MEAALDVNEIYRWMEASLDVNEIYRRDARKFICHGLPLYLHARSHLETSI